MNLELLARLQQDHLQELHGEARRASSARAALRLPESRGETLAAFRSWIRSFGAPAQPNCCQAAA